MNQNKDVTPRGPGTHHDEWIGGEPSVLVFDVNETLIDFESMNPLFERIFGDRRVMREWLGHLVMYSMTITLSGLYEGFFTLGQGLLRMVGDIHGVEVTDADIEEIRNAMLTMPAHPDVEAGLNQLKDAGFRMVTLTNSPPNPKGPSPLEHAGLAHFFERQFTIETTRAYKPAPQTYHLVAQALEVPPSTCFMVAAHVWDTVGAQSAGYTAGLLTRPGNAPLPVRSLPQPNLVAPDLPALATQLIERRRS
ncbi:haloacid dehalogenase [Planotetraspora silvatica]|uniref:Haloacid dehalogenase n=1 Tax=Planotetraspora silvatica TaxID=234614 RepID=A0A8J3UQX2_9ACTN|nr:haloacid dehalogenase type II [Planotetraspora silvatica]GII46724.1 haloacid dehalogenase [Planotetraspora silvatica]